MSWHHHPFRSLLCLSICAVLIASCIGSGHKPTEDELSAFGKHVYELDTMKMEEAMRQILKADTSHYDIDKALRAHYASSEALSPVWFTRMGVSPDADSLLSVLRHELPYSGLDTTSFALSQIAEDLAITHALTFDSLGLNINEVLTRLDYLLSRAFMRYTVGQRYGFTRPAKLLNHLDTKAEGDYARLFDIDIVTPDMTEALKALVSGERIAYLLASEPQSPLYRALQAKLAATTDTEQQRTLAVNMERARWRMKQPEATGRHILVNIPSQQLWAISSDTILTMRICCGTTLTKTPLLRSAISHIEVNPAWIIPMSIIKAEVSPHAGDSAYFARHRYSIVNRSTGATLSPTAVTAEQLRSGSYRVSQRGGAGNSLGRIVFRFPNNFSVYLHDTSTPGAFQRERRTLSHGCIRVQKPFELACFTMPDADEWTLDRLRISMDIPPATDRGREYLSEHVDDERPLRLINYQKINPHVPIDIVYFTAYPNPETDSIEFWPDLYGYDKHIRRALTLP